MAIENFELYEEQDTANRLTVTSSRATGADVDRDLAVYLYFDKGLDNFNALDIDFTIFMASSSQNGAQAGMGLSNTIGQLNAWDSDDVCAQIYKTPGGAYEVRLCNGQTAVKDIVAGGTNKIYYCTMSRAAGNATVTLDIYNDSGRTDKYTTLTLGVFGTVKWQYVYGFVNIDTGDGGRNFDGYVENLDLHEVVAPDAPTNLAATDNLADRSTLEWDRPAGDITGNKIYEGENLIDTIGNVEIYHDMDAPAPTITPGNAVATDGGIIAHVALHLDGESTANGASRTYKVVAFNAAGDGDPSNTDTGHTVPGALTYQWQRSDADADADYNTNIGTTEAYNDTGAPENGDGRYYRCVLDAAGAAQQISTVDRGYRSVVYEESCTDGIVAGDTPAPTRELPLAITDGIVGSDTPGVYRTLPLSVTDGITGGDTPGKQTVLEGVISDGVVLGDTALIYKLLGLSLTDGAVLGDTPTKQTILEALASDGIVLGDTPSKQSILKGIITDGIVLGDTALIYKLLKLALTDGAVLGDTPSKQSVLEGLITDGLVLGDTPVPTRELPLAATDGVVMGDTPLAKIVAENLVTDGITLGDTPTTQAVLEGVLTDGVTMSDTALAKLVLEALVTDGVTMGDAPTVFRTLSFALTDGMTLGEVLAVFRTLPLSATDGIVGGDIALSQVIFQSLVTDGVTMGDTALSQAVLLALITDGITMGDAASTTAILLAAITDGIKMGDTPTTLLRRLIRMLLKARSGARMRLGTGAGARMGVKTASGARMYIKIEGGGTK